MGNIELERELTKILDNLETDKVIFLTDLVGGTPFSSVALLGKSNPSYKVLGGCNIAMVIAALEIGDADNIEVVNEVLAVSKKGIALYQS